MVVSTIGVACVAVGVDTANWYVEVQKVQKAADAAALGGVPFLPQDLASARARALEIAARNGYDNNGDNRVVVLAGERATQLEVSISSTIANQFGTSIGVGNTTITQSATADYQGPAPMGSPCNTFGNEPSAGNRNSTNGGASPRPPGTAQSSATQVYCPRTPQFWATVEGPQTGKVQGDRYQTLRCEDNGVDGCDSSRINEDYDPFGYVFVVKVDPAAVGRPVDLQLFDPMMINTGSACEQLPPYSRYSSNAASAPNLVVNPYVTLADAARRYTRDAPASAPYNSSLEYCTGDSFPGAGSGLFPRRPLTTSFVLRQQDDSQNPVVAPVQRATDGSECIRQFGAHTPGGEFDVNLITQGQSVYNDDIAASLHNWMTLCRFTPPRAGDYYLQVRTNVELAGAARPGGPGLIRSGNAAAAAATGNTTSGEGSNSFAVRAVTPSGLEGRVSVSGYNHMPIYINSASATANFHLIRVLPGAAGQKISFSYFDAGDAQGNGSVRVLVPTDATGSIATTPFPGACTSYGGSAGGSITDQRALSNCSAPIQKQGSSSTSRNNGKVQTITIPIPTDYDCNATSYSGCWYKVRVNFAGSTSVTDVTTWDATVIGDPVRLVK